MRTITAGIECPLIGQRATVELARDEWTRRFTDVTLFGFSGRKQRTTSDPGTGDAP
jgi:hypothetical protein